MRYEHATFLIHIGEMVRVEISIRGCANDRDSVDPLRLQQVGETCIRVAQAIEQIKREVEAQEQKQEQV